MASKSEKLRQLLNKRKVVENGVLLNVLGTNSSVTLFRYLKKLGYMTSYSHAGKFYTLLNIPKFDISGLWFFMDVGFSKFGTLKATAVNMIEKSNKGMTHSELEELLRVRAQNTLRDLVNNRTIKRERVGGVFVYTSSNKKHAVAQLTRRTEILPDKRKILLPSQLDPYSTIEILVTLLQSSDWDPDAIAKTVVRKGFGVTKQQVEGVLKHFKIKKKIFR